MVEAVPEAAAPPALVPLAEAGIGFAELGLSEAILSAVTQAGYTRPTPIQAKAIPFVLQGRDVLGCAQTGTGKTASFTLPMIDRLAAGRARARMPRSLILEPTRELAAQVADNFSVYGAGTRLSFALLVGGESMDEQVKKLERGVDVLIATPGRLIDLFERGRILLTDIRILVIDECDRMLDMGFIPDIERIVSMLPRTRQTLLFSATLPPEIRRLADKFLQGPEEITVAPPASPAKTVTQGLVRVGEDDKRKALRQLLRTEQVKNAIIFCNRKRDVAKLHKSLERHGFNAGALHGDMPQPKRTETLAKFKANELDLLVCSDVAARGLDIQGLSHVFNFDVPMHAEDYVHRIGRTGRAGREGRAITLATGEDGKFLAAIEKLIGRAIPPMQLEAFTEADVGQREGDADEGGDRRDRRGRHDDRRRDDRRGDARRGDERRGDERRNDERRGDDRRRERRPVEAAEGEAPRSSIRPRGDLPVRGEHQGRAEARPEGVRRDHLPPREDYRRDDYRRDERRERYRRDAEPEGPPVVGFGDNVPAFMYLPKAKAAA